MFRFASRVARLRHALTIVAVATVGACADDQSITAPRQNAAEPRVAAGASTLENTDATVVTISPDREGNVRMYSGYAGVTGMVTCSKAGEVVRLHAIARQDIMKDKTGITGAGDVTLTCTTSPQFFQVIIVPYFPELGPFKRGRMAVDMKAFIADALVGQVSRTIRLEPVASY